MLLSKVSDCFQTGFTWASWFQLDFNCMTVWNQSETLESKAWRASIRLATIEIDPLCQRTKRKFIGNQLRPYRDLQTRLQVRMYLVSSRFQQHHECRIEFGILLILVKLWNSFELSISAVYGFYTAHFGQALKMSRILAVYSRNAEFKSVLGLDQDEPYTSRIQQTCWVQVDFNYLFCSIRLVYGSSWCSLRTD